MSTSNKNHQSWNSYIYQRNSVAVPSASTVRLEQSESQWELHGVSLNSLELYTVMLNKDDSYFIVRRLDISFDVKSIIIVD